MSDALLSKVISCSLHEECTVSYKFWLQIRRQPIENQAITDNWMLPQNAQSWTTVIISKDSVSVYYVQTSN